MNSSFQRIYAAQPFDPSDPRDARAERARKILLQAALTSIEELDTPNGEALQDVAGGLLVGLVCVILSSQEITDINHSHTRAGLIELIPWAVDIVRSMQNLPPLSSGN